MKILSRIIALLLVVPATYFFIYWLPCSLLPLGDQRWIANLLSLLCAVAVGWYVWKKLGSGNNGVIPSILLGAVLLGGIGFTGGFFGPMIFTPRSNQGPMLGIFITGPLGFLVGGVIGFIYWITRKQVQSDTEVVNSNIAVQNVQKIQLKNEFALEKNTASLAALFIMASMLIYALVDTVFINLYEIVGYPDIKSLLIVLSAMPICLLGFIFYSLMIRSSVPERETIVLTILCVISLAITAHPLLQRIDTIIASKPMQTYNYRMIKPGVFEPVEIGPPKLNLRTQCEYWQQYTVNTSYQISLQHGGLGMWQLDGEALDKDIYAYLKKIHPANFIGNFRIK